MQEARRVHAHTGKPARRFRDFRYRTRKSWSRERRVIGKAEYLPNKANPRFVVTNLNVREAAAKRLYEPLYCARGDITLSVPFERFAELKGLVKARKRWRHLGERCQLDFSYQGSMMPRMVK
jgi:hypothetical protein